MKKDISVLFLNDDHDALNLIHKLSTQEAYGIFTTADPDRAWEILRKEKIKVVLSDQYLPKTQGTQFLQEVMDFDPNIVRILVTDRPDFEMAKQAVNLAGVFRIITKPLGSVDLVHSIRQAISRYDLSVKAHEANESLKSIYEMKIEFTSIVSHELRTPLASIKTAIDLVFKRILGPLNPDQSEVLGRAKRNVDRLKRLIDDILDLTKMESGKLTMHFAVSDLRRVVEEIVELQKSLANTRGLYLKTGFDDIPYIRFDSDRISQVLNNLISNAIKFTKHGGLTVKLLNRPKEGYVLVSIADTGKGIAEENLLKVFEKFYQVESAEENEEGGTGLGLAICKEIIAKHGGVMWVESELNKGSTFYFTLPLSV